LPTRLEKNKEEEKRACKQSLTRTDTKKKIKEEKRESGAEKQVIEEDARDRDVSADD